ncbi:nickel-dependent hydrogenase large subunit [Candidatus Woesearchaeota archaeon]|nr:nickel-dependent hydrogenase large subunit [Candidatus Woesearchaeota archaeon]
MSDYKNIIDPLNRIEGDLAIELSVGADNVVKDAKCLGFVYRGLENIFIGRKAFDAMRMSQRACGVCPVSHGTAGAKAIEDAVGIKPPRNAQLIRDIVLGTNTIVSHLTHFYFMWGPDIVDEKYKDYKYYDELLKRFNPLASPHLKTILTQGRIPLHSIVATFGGKFPHPMHAVPGGVTCLPKQIELNKVNTILNDVKELVEQKILGVPVDAALSLKSTKDVLETLKKNKEFAAADLGFFIKAALDLGLDKLDKNTPNNFLAYGFGELKNEKWLFRPGYVEHGHYHELDSTHISEDTALSYYETSDEWPNPMNGVTKPFPKKEGAYSWLKAARYFGKVVEVGPLARQIVNGNPLITDLVKNLGVNTFTRTIARLHECLLILPQLIAWVDEIDLAKPFYKPFDEAKLKGVKGAGLVEAPRGALGHWINTGEDSLVTRYQIITPTTWNASPTDSKGQKGAIEQALIGVKLAEKDSMLEAGHIVRSFDPCISCAIHAVGKKKKSLFIEHSI